ncbi:hypothetical protein [uncultured Sulfitobacter sp.]|uniref:hypothetical protein n=1 Tax=uncultured Sulfitobacter sp. TaxID=191468 RepID=UPI00260B96E1|nr:hypothetical protein [uncultured Sulfitobacter sp.]
MILGSPEFVADAAVSICGAIGAFIVLRSLDDIVQTAPVRRSFRFCLWVLVVLMVARVGHWGNMGWAFTATTYAMAALIPLAALLLAEVLLRRHAPPWLKKLCGGGAVVFVLLGLVSFDAIEFWHVLGLLLLQLVGLTGVAWFTFSRDYDSLSLAENQSISRMALSFLLILPFMLSDFMRTPAVDLPVRLGGLAVLALCWLSIGFRRSGLKQSEILRGFGSVVVVSVGLTLLLMVVAPLSMRNGMQVVSVLVAAIMLLAIWQASIALHIEDGSIVAMREMARVTGSGPQAGLELLRRGAGAPEAVLLLESDLGDFDIPALRGEFASLNHRQQIDAGNSELMNWLFSRYGATHAVALTQDPLILVMLNNPAIAGADTSQSGFGAIARMATLITGEKQS